MKAKVFNGYPVLNLSAFELELTECLCSHMSKDEIAVAMNIRSTKANYWGRHIFGIFKVHNKIDLIYVCLHYGYIDAEIMLGEIEE